jgi:AraC-like DNA-binding protein
MDPLSDVLRAVKLNGAYFYKVEASRPWSLLSAPARELMPPILPYAEHLIPYHILLSGSCWAGLHGEQQVHMQPGDVVVFPQGPAHLMSGAEGWRDEQRDSNAPGRFPNTVYLGPDDTRDTNLVCGFLGCDTRPFNPLLASLPSTIHLSGIAGGWLAQFPQQVVAESRQSRLGGDTMLTRMAELMFIEVVRKYLEKAPDQQSGWLAGLMDPLVGRALTALHERPAHPWTLADLAREIASSRTVLADRFTRLVGVSPMLYLTRWRLQLAAEQLGASSAKVAAVAGMVGYDSEAAFSRAFKRETGLSPATWRRTRQMH